MKIIKRIVIWSMLSLALQMSGFYYINKYYLSDETHITVSKLQKSTETEKTADVSVPDGAENISASYNGKYVAYYDSNVIKVVDMSSGEVKTIDFDSGVEVSYFKWLSDRNRMLIAEKHKTSSGMSFELSYYDVGKDTKDTITELAWAGKSAEVSDIEASPLTNMIFIKIALNDYQSSIYSLNIMGSKNKVSTVVSRIGNICIVPHVDKLYYEDSQNSRVYSTSTKSKMEIGGSDKLALLSIDSSDDVFLGGISSDDTVKRIYHGQSGADASTYAFVDLATPVMKEDIFVSNDGNIYLNDNFKGILTELATGKQYTYTGNFIQIYDGGIMSLSENKIVKTPFTSGQ
jgi:hypothetical protein